MQKSLQINDAGIEKNIFLKSDADIYEISMDLTNLILDKYENNIIEFIIKKHYDYLESKEQMFVEENSKKHLNNKRTQMQTYIFEKISDYVQRENMINIYGFIMFRLKSYISQIENAVDISVNEFIVEREYEQLIDGLILYTELQVPMIDTINIIQKADKYIVTDNCGKEIFTLYNYDDVLLDVILTLSPCKIVIINSDNFKNKELIETIVKIFSKRVILINKA